MHWRRQFASRRCLHTHTHNVNTGLTAGRVHSERQSKKAIQVWAWPGTGRRGRRRDWQKDIRDISRTPGRTDGPTDGRTAAASVELTLFLLLTWGDSQPVSGQVRLERTDCHSSNRRFPDAGKANGHDVMRLLGMLTVLKLMDPTLNPTAPKKHLFALLGKYGCVLLAANLLFLLSPVCVCLCCEMSKPWAAHAGVCWCIGFCCVWWGYAGKLVSLVLEEWQKASLHTARQCCMCAF